MIIDAHLHAFPPLDGASGYPSAAAHARMLQNKVPGYWRRMVTNTLDERFRPERDEDVAFRIGKYGRYHWRKAGRDCWMQRFPLSMENMDWPPERMVAHMDAVGVQVGVLQAGYMEANFCRDYFADCVRRWPDRFVSTVAVDFDIAKDERHRRGELDKLEYAVAEQFAKGVFQGFPKGQPMDAPEFDPFWAKLVALGLPHIFLLGYEAREPYLLSLRRLMDVRRRHPALKIVIGHLGGNVYHPDDPEHSDTPIELLPLLATPNTWFEVGYVLAYENKDVWGADYEYPYPRHTELIRRIHDAVGAEGLIWASDMPNLERACTYLQCLETVRMHCRFLSERERAMVLGGNAARLFGIPMQAHPAAEAAA